MKRIAAPMVGGLTTSFLLELTVYPAIFAVWKSHVLDLPSTKQRWRQPAAVTTGSDDASSSTAAEID